MARQQLPNIEIRNNGVSLISAADRVAGPLVVDTAGYRTLVTGADSGAVSGVYGWNSGILAGNAYYDGAWHRHNPASAAASISADATGDTHFYTTPAGGSDPPVWAERLVIQSDGHLVLSTNSKAYRARHSDSIVRDLIGATGDGNTYINCGPLGLIVHNVGVTARLLNLDNSGNLGLVGDLVLGAQSGSGYRIGFVGGNFNISIQGSGGAMYIDAGAGGWNWRDSSAGHPTRMHLSSGGLLDVYGGINLTVTALHNFWQYAAGTMDLGNAVNIPSQIRGAKAWGGALTVIGTGSTGFIEGGGIVGSIALPNGEGRLFIARDGYWWTIAKS